MQEKLSFNFLYPNIIMNIKNSLYPVICDISNLSLIVLVSDGWCRMRMHHARLMSYAFLYTTSREIIEFLY